MVITNHYKRKLTLVKVFLLMSMNKVRRKTTMKIPMLLIQTNFR